MKVKHSKIRNTGILFELLVRKIASDVLDGRQDSFAIKIMKEHFHSKTELGKELQLYRSFFNVNDKLSEVKAFNMLDIVLEKRKSLNEKLLEVQKFLLIKEIKQNCDLKSFMSGRIPSYKVYASIYKLFESATKTLDNSNISNIDEILSSRFVVVEHLKKELKEERMIKENTYTETLKHQPEEIRHLSFKFLLERFNEKYSVFSDKQKNLLREYINNGMDIEKFSGFISNEASTLLQMIKSNLHNVNSDILQIKLKETCMQLENIKQKPNVNDNYITALLIAYQISHELDLLS